MDQVRAALLPEEPDYAHAAQLGPDALPHLRSLVRGSDMMLASKAAYLAGLQEAAQSSHAPVRVAAAATSRNLPAAVSGQVLPLLLSDQDAGVRRLALRSVPADAPEAVRQKVENLLQQDPEESIRALSQEVLRKARSENP
jgi:hypothetical protein